MVFTLNFENIDFTFKLHPAQGYTPDKGQRSLDHTTLKAIEAGQAGHFQLFITSSRGEESYQHYIPNLVLPTDQEECLEELELYLNEEGGLDKVLEFWKRLESSAERPRWAK